MTEIIPEQQWSITCNTEGKIQVKKIDVPKPAYGEVLVKCMAAPINPSDVWFLKGIYSKSDIFDIQYPNQPGWEGAGIVIQSGGGAFGWWRSG
jgi:NADPH2:quinone reductase